MISQAAPTLSIDSRRMESPTLASNSSSPNPREPESHHTTSLDVAPTTMNHYDGDSHKSELPPLDPVVPNLEEKKSGVPNVGEIPNGDFVIGIHGSPTGSLPNPYESAASQTEAPDYYGLQTFASLSSGEPENENLNRMPSVLRPANPRYFDTMDNRRASMALVSQGDGLPPLPSEGGRRSMASDGRRSMASDERRPFMHDGRKSFTSAGRKSALVGRESVTSENGMRPFPRVIERPHTIVGSISFSSETGVPFSSVNGGLTVTSPEFGGGRMRRHSAVDTSPTTARMQHFPRHSSFSYDTLPVENSHSEGDIRPDHGPDRGTMEQQLKDLRQVAKKHPLNKKPSRWKFWSKKKSNSARV